MGSSCADHGALVPSKGRKTLTLESLKSLPEWWGEDSRSSFGSRSLVLDQE